MAMNILTEFSHDAVVETLNHAYNNGYFENTLLEQFRQFVPCVFASMESLNAEKEERKAKKVLLRPLETFLCAGDPDIVFLALQANKPQPKLCGRVFKNGEPTYYCRDCGMDPTCVLCSYCFLHSSHRKHRYRMSTSGGGGYCDCGDFEAWKTDPLCAEHLKGKDDPGDALNQLPVGMCERARVLFAACARHCVRLLTWQDVTDVPENLRLQTSTDQHVCMLFNDEIHTYDQVISTLQRAIGCSQEAAVDFATIVDREGRSAVRHGMHKDCDAARDVIEKKTSRMGHQPLRCQTMHLSVYSHQSFAQRLLTWMQNIFDRADGLLRIFFSVVMETDGNGDSLLDKMLLADTWLWKSARVQNQQLLMCGVLKDNEIKKHFAVTFTKLYPRLMSDFIRDDHDHSVSAVASSVQLFTVPTLARMLVAEHDLLRIILDTFMVECKKKINTKGILSFERGDRTLTFRRAQYTLYDLKYALSCRPLCNEWSAQLRQKYVSGLVELLRLLKAMEGMDSVTRQTGPHVEFEPEWEGAFNLQLKLSDVIELMLLWTSTDLQVAREALRSTLTVLNVTQGSQPVYQERSVGKYSTAAIKYDVSKEPVSVHQPLTRFLAGILQQMSLHGVMFDQLEIQPGLKELMEPALRCVVLVAQSSAQMWRRNGYALLNQIYFYQNVRCRQQMADKDLLLLQVAASMMKPNDFLVCVLCRFGLINWAREDYDEPKEATSAEESTRHIISLAEEFFTLVIQLLGERYQPGVGEVTAEDDVKREVIHQLCLQPMSHSQLCKALPEDTNHETGIEEAVEKVAVFNKPTKISGKGMFELKKEYYAQFSPYFAHYSKQDQSKAEETQRKRVRAEQNNSALIPPNSPPFAKNFRPINKLMACDVMLHLMKLVLRRSAATRSKSWSDTQLDQTLYLIGMALIEERQGLNDATRDLAFTKSATSAKYNLKVMLEVLVGHNNLTHDGQKDMLTWILKTFSQVEQLRCNASPSSSLRTLGDKDNSVKSPEAEKRAQMAAKRRQKILEQMAMMQKQFIQENKELFDKTSTEHHAEQAKVDEPEDRIQFPVAIGDQKSPATYTARMRYTCILCQEEQDVSHSGRALVMAAYVQKSTVLSKVRGETIGDPEAWDPLFMPSSFLQGTYTSVCGHVMHSDCWQSFYDAILTRERRRTRMRIPFSYDVDKQEFLCPLCETLANSVIPLIPQLPTLVPAAQTAVQMGSSSSTLSLDDFLDVMQKTIRASVQQAASQENEAEDLWTFVPCPLSSITKMMADTAAYNFRLLYEYVYDDLSASFSEGVTDMIRKFTKDVYTVGLGVSPDDDNIRVPLMAWQSCAYTIMSIEHLLRAEKKPLFGAMPARYTECLGSLVRFASVGSIIIQQSVIKRHCVTLLSGLLSDNDDVRLQKTPNILDIEMFHLLVSLCLSLPSLYAEDEIEATLTSSKRLQNLPKGSQVDLLALHTIVLAHLVQILLTYSQEKDAVAMETQSDEETEGLVTLLQLVRRSAGLPLTEDPLPWLLRNEVRSRILPFLRCACIFFHYITGVRVPDQLYEEHEDQYATLCQYLSLPTNLTEIFKSSSILQKLVVSWCERDDVKQRLTNERQVTLFTSSTRRLVQLPSDYTSVMTQASTFTCPKWKGDDSRAPTLCLVCGEMLCSQSYCCQVQDGGLSLGAATAHARSCGAGMCLFLRVRECQILMLCSKVKGSFHSPPYLDAYGETDQGLKRGNPLTLCEERYEQLEKLWLSHSIAEEVARNLEANTSLSQVDWNHL